MNSSGHFLVVITIGWSANAGDAGRSPCYVQQTLFRVRSGGAGAKLFSVRVRLGLR